MLLKNDKQFLRILLLVKMVIIFVDILVIFITFKNN